MEILKLEAASRVSFSELVCFFSHLVMPSGLGFRVRWDWTSVGVRHETSFFLSFNIYFYLQCVRKYHKTIVIYYYIIITNVEGYYCHWIPFVSIRWCQKKKSNNHSQERPLGFEFKKKKKNPLCNELIDGSMYTMDYMDLNFYFKF